MNGHIASTQVLRLVPNEGKDRNSRKLFIEEPTSIDQVKDGDYIKIVKFSNQKMFYVPVQIISQDYEGPVIHLIWERRGRLSFCSEQNCICAVFFNEYQFPRVEEKLFSELGIKQFKNGEYKEDLTVLRHYSMGNPNETDIDKYIEKINETMNFGLGPIQQEPKVVTENYKGKVYNILLPIDCAILTSENYLIAGTHEETI